VNGFWQVEESAEQTDVGVARLRGVGVHLLDKVSCTYGGGEKN